MREDQRAECPRCGHDLRGPQAGWREACPLAGRCPDCGLDFAWGDLLSGRMHYPRWCVEGARSPLNWGLRAGPQLAVATFRPRMLLGRLRLEHRIRPLRLAGAFAGFLVLLAVAGWVTISVGYVLQRMPVGTAVIESFRVWDEAPRRIVASLATIDPSLVAVDTRTGALLLERDRLGPVPTRIGLNDPVPDDGLPLDDGGSYLEVATANGGVIVVQSQFTVTIGVAPPPDDAEFHLASWVAGPLGADMAYAQTLPGPVGYRDFGGPYGQEMRSVAGTQRMVVDRTTIDRARAMTSVASWYMPPLDVLRDTARGMPTVLFAVGSSLAPMALAGVAFAILPIARRRARVRWSHLGRLMGYAALGATGLAITISALARILGLTDDLGALPGGRVGGSLDEQFVRVGDGHFLIGVVLFWLLPTVVASIWWTWAAGRYLRMSRPFAVGTSVAVVTSLSVPAAIILVLRVIA